MSNTPAKKPGHALKWISGGIIAGICLGIIAAFIIIALGHSGGSPSWEWTKVIFAIEAFRLGFFGALIGALVGYSAWSHKLEKWTKESDS